MTHDVPDDLAIHVSDLGRCFGRRWAVRHLSFDLPWGRVMGLLGPNGAGKTTTVRMLTGLLAPSEGTASVAGRDICTRREDLGGVIGVTFEQQNLYERLTVRQNLAFFCDLGSVRRERIGELLEQADLADRVDDPVSKLSRGMRQRVALVRALLSSPRVLFLDEPTAGLDPVAARGVRRWLSRIAAEGTSVLLTTHDMEEAQLLCHQVAIVHEGSLVALDTPAALIARISPARLVVTLRDAEGQAPREVALPPEPAQAASELAVLQARHEVLGLREQASTLEDVFLQLTGHALNP